MTINVEKTKQLIEIFSGLNEANQNALLSQALKMEIEQAATRSLEMSGITAKNPTFDAAKSLFFSNRKTLVNNLNDMTPNQLASLAMFMNEISNGQLAKEEHIDFVVTTRQLSITEFIEKNIPGANIDEARKLYLTLKETLNI